MKTEVYTAPQVMTVRFALSIFSAFAIAMLLASCADRPSAIFPDGTIVRCGTSVGTKSGSESSYVKATNGSTQVEMWDQSTGHDETAIPGAVVLGKTTEGVVGAAAKVVK